MGKNSTINVVLKYYRQNRFSFFKRDGELVIALRSEGKQKEIQRNQKKKSGSGII